MGVPTRNHPKDLVKFSEEVMFSQGPDCDRGCGRAFLPPEDSVGTNSLCAFGAPFKSFEVLQCMELGIKRRVAREVCREVLGCYQRLGLFV